jgi:hypothetical protein
MERHYKDMINSVAKEIQSREKVQVGSIKQSSEKYYDEYVQATNKLNLSGGETDEDTFPNQSFLNFVNHSIVSKRPYVHCSFNNVLTTHALLDLGSCTNCVSILTLEEIETELGHVLPRVPTDISQIFWRK